MYYIKKMWKIAIAFTVLFLALLVTEICIALFFHDAFVRPYVGDVLVTVLLCCLLRMFVPEGVGALPIYVFVFAVAVEIGQCFDMVKLLGLEDSRFFSVLLGTTFSVYDLLCYAVGCLLFLAVEYLVNTICCRKATID